MTSSRKRLRRLLLLTHRWLGLVLGLWFVVISLTGALLAWGPELISAEMLRRDPSHQSEPGQAMISVATALESLLRAEPELAAEDVGLIVAPNFRYPHYLFPIRKLHGLVYKVDPYDGAVLKPYRKSDLLMGKVSEFHENLLLGAAGLLANTVASVLLLVLLAAGVWLWWPSTWRALRRGFRFRRPAPAVVRWLAWHNLLGLLTLVPVALMTITSVFMSLDDLTQGGVARTLGEGPKLTASATPGEPRPLDELVAAATAQADGLPLFLLQPGFAGDHLFRATFQAPTGLLNQVTVVIDPVTGEVLSRTRPAEAPRGKRFTLLMRDLHLGVFGGLTSKLIFTAAGVLPLIIALTGFWLWWRGTVRRTALRQRPHERPLRRGRAPEPAVTGEGEAIG